MVFPLAPSTAVWNELALAAGNIFATRTWAECWWRQYGGGATPLVLTDRVDRPRVLVPLYKSGRVLRQLRFIGNGPADELGPACAPAHRPLAAELIHEVLLRGQGRRDWDLLLLQDVPEAHGWTDSFEGHEIRRTPSPSLTFDTDSWDEFLKGRSRNFRDQARRRRRQVEQKFSAVFRTATADTLADDLQTLFRLHRLRWGHDAPFAQGAERALHEEFAPLALEAGWLRLHVLELDGTPAATLYNFRFGASEGHYQGGRDPRFDDSSVGFVLYTHAIRQALESGVTEFRMLRGDESYKARFSNTTEYLHSVAVPGSARGRAAVAATRYRRSR